MLELLKPMQEEDFWTTLLTLKYDGKQHTLSYGCFKNSGTPKSSILKGLSIINHPFWGTPIFGNTHMEAFWRTESGITDDRYDDC